MRLARVAAGVIALLSVGCGGVEHEPNLATAIERTEAMRSTRFEITALETEDGQKIKLICQGATDYAGKRIQVSCENGLLREWEMRVIGDVMYIRSDGDLGLGFGSGKRWQKLSAGGNDSSYDFSPDRLLAMLRAASRETQRVGEEDVRGEPTVRYRLTVNCEEAELICPGDSAPVEVWIDGDGLVRRIWVDDSGFAGTIEFFDFGVGVDIEAPPADQVADPGEGWTGYGPPQPGNAAPCSEGEGAPIAEQQALAALRDHGFSMRIEACVGGKGVVAGLTNHDEAGEIVSREGLVFCHVFAAPRDDAPKRVVRRGADGADAELLLGNLTCTILADSPNGEQKVDRLEGAFDALERVIRP